MRLRFLLLLPLMALLPAKGDAAGEEVRTGFERALGARLALGDQTLRVAAPCPDEGWLAAPPGRAPAHRSAHPFVLRVLPRRCAPEVGPMHLRLR